MQTYEELLRLLRKKQFDKKINFLSKKYQNKNIIIYGAGQLSQVIFDNYDLSSLNITAIADIKYIQKSQNEKFHGYTTISSYDIPDHNPQVILVSITTDTDKQDKLIRFLKDQIMSGLQITVEPIIEEEFLDRISHHREIINFLKKTPLSSEIIGTPKDFIGIEDWLNSGSKAAKLSNIIRLKPEIISENRIKSISDQKPYENLTKTYKYNQYSSYIVCIPNGRVYGNEATIITPDDKVLIEESTDIRSPHVKYLPIFSKIKLPAVKRINETVAVLSTSVSYNYYHWIYDVLTRLILIKKSQTKPDKYLVKSNTPLQKESLKLLDISEEQIINNDENTHIKAKTLIVPSFLYGISQFKADILREELLKFAQTDTCPERIYISREDAPYRKVTNEDEVMNLLKNYGFKKIELSQKSFVEQISIFAKANFIIAPHGAGLTNLVFSQPGAKIIEIASPDFVSESFWNVSNCINLDHYSITGEKDSISCTDDQYKIRRNILVNTEKLAYLIDYILKQDQTV